MERETHSLTLTPEKDLFFLLYLFLQTMNLKDVMDKFLELNDRIEDVLLQIPTVMKGTRDSFDDLVLIREALRDIRDDVLILLSEIKRGKRNEQPREDTEESFE